ncbi:hypothetical protein HPB47_005355 [Ixodes persulcatus]|uniref:Uncharacterized protein n=1 Tax=Ixodes persulcatus TaxID=34615 RepID=A0AC60PDG6_IXOPE|nr:hypothetical protein HPB47_005355 [Ixodes persulcatus]
MDSGVLGIANPNYSLEEDEAVPRTRDASTMTPRDTAAKGTLENGQFELYQAPTGRDFNIGKLLGRIKSSAAVKSDVSETFLKKPGVVYNATATLVGKLTAWMDRKAATKSKAATASREADTQTYQQEEPGPPFEDVPL